MLVAPFAGAWIEIFIFVLLAYSLPVAPFAGAWIEISANASTDEKLKSLRSSERGLKYYCGAAKECGTGRSVRRSVD